MSTQPESVIVYGPQGCGKTTQANKLAAYFGLRNVVDDDWNNRHIKRTGTLYITNLTLRELAESLRRRGAVARHIMPFARAMTLMTSGEPWAG